MYDVVKFSSRPIDGGLEITPWINDRCLIDLVAEFETANKMEQFGRYFGIEATVGEFGNLKQYYRGIYEKQSHFEYIQASYLLGCGCGMSQCWPLAAKISRFEDHYRWSDFENAQGGFPYDGFGPFKFERLQYEQEIESL